MTVSTITVPHSRSSLFRNLLNQRQADLSARTVFKVQDRDRAGTVSTSETETEDIQSQQARPRLLFINIRD